jgi:hypothetical protein
MMNSREHTAMKERLAPLTVETLRHYKSLGYTQDAIAEITGWSNSWVSLFNKQKGPVMPTPRQLAMESWPWRVWAEHQQCSPHKRMRDHTEFMATGGDGMADYKLRRLAGFYNRLIESDWVVEYDPHIPPSEGIKTGGWAYRQRLDSDGDLMIRVNEHTNLTPIGRLIYRIPEENMP